MNAELFSIAQVQENGKYVVLKRCKTSKNGAIFHYSSGNDEDNVKKGNSFSAIRTG
jgi:hypothetical protein